MYILCNQQTNNQQLKELVETNILLMEENQELIHKLKRTNELREKQIQDLENTVEQLNNELKHVKGNTTNNRLQLLYFF